MPAMRPWVDTGLLGFDQLGCKSRISEIFSLQTALSERFFVAQKHAADKSTTPKKGN
jgi:hypothetical protein